MARDREAGGSVPVPGATDGAPASATESTFAGIAEILSDAVITVDTRHVITSYNRGAAEIFGWTPDEVVGRPLDILLPERFRAIHPQHVREFGRSDVVARRMGERRAISGLRKSGDEFPAEASIARLDIDGERVFAVVLRDITNRRRAEEAQQFLARAGATLASSLEYGETLTSIVGMALESFADWCVVYGVAADDSVRPLRAAHADPALQPLLDRLLDHPISSPSPHPALTVIDTGEAELVADYSSDYIDAIAQNRKHGEVLRQLAPRSAVFVPLYARERVVGAIALVSSGRRCDGDDLALAEELARRASIALENARLYRAANEAVDLREEVLRVVSHDLGNPLSAIFVGLKVLRRQLETGGTTDAHEPIGMIHDSAVQLRRLIDDLLEVQRIEAGRLAMDMKSVDVAPLIERAADQMRPIAEDRGIILKHGTRGAIVPVHGDVDRLLQVFGNLIGNAIKFTPRGGTVRITAEPRDGWTVFAVADSGPGIAADDLPHVFERFWRAKSAGGLGSGLGLAIARGIIDAHGGEIWAESVPDAGATFFFRLAAHREPVRQASPRARSHE